MLAGYRRFIQRLTKDEAISLSEGSVDSEDSLFGLSRDQLTAVGAILLVIGIVLFLSAAGTMMASPSNPFDFAAVQQQMNSAFVLGFFGLIMFGGGAFLLRMGLVRPVTTYVAAEASPAIETVSRSMAEGMREGLSRGGGIPIKLEQQATSERPEIMVKCRNCGHLNPEDATYCNNCAKQL